MTNKVTQTQEELKNHLNEQLGFLMRSAEAYDKGHKSEAKQMAAKIRLLLHDTKKSQSLLGQLNLKGLNFYSTVSENLCLKYNKSQAIGYHGLLDVSFGGSAGYLPHLDDIHENDKKFVDFNTYWTEPIFVDKEGECYSREFVVRAVADQDGGAHVDSAIDGKYAKLSRMNCMGWKVGDDKGNWEDMQGAELAAIRQITHELLRTLVPSYPIQKKPPINGFVIGGMTPIFSEE